MADSWRASVLNEATAARLGYAALRPRFTMTTPTLSISPDRFEAMYAEQRDAVRGYVHRMIGHPGDADDLVQTTALKAYERRTTLRSEAAFRSWLFRIATTTCLDFLRKQKRWRPLSQAYAERECAENQMLRDEVIATTKDPEFAFDVHEHMAFCLTCVGRSLDPAHQAALVLREIAGFSNQEAADIVGVSESVLRHHLAAARRSMEDTYEGLCALVSKSGICHQCAGFRAATTEARRGPALPVLDQAPDRWAARLDAARQRHFAGGVSQSLHDLLFARIRRIESSGR